MIVMCGICGQFNFGDQEPVTIEGLIRMTRALAHRGPDDEGFFISGALGLGFRRLSIIDLAGGHQPMTDREESVWVVFNGEIYNFPKLKRELGSFGHVFRTRSDTEIIIQGYKQWGTGVFERLRGMFGVAIWDVKNRRLVLARDAMGIKPVYYMAGAGRITFGSEIKALLAAGTESPDIDPVSLNLFLRYRYTPSPLTIFKGIRKLAAGTMMVVENGNTRLERWYVRNPKPQSPPISAGEAKEELLRLYKISIKRHLLSDVPLGLLLSGGIDSGLLLGLMNREGDSWPTYTIGYGKSYSGDELDEAAKTARIFSSRHTSIEIDRNNFESTLPKVLSFLEEPIASSSIVPMYLVCERAKQDVKVVLIGQGPDELFGGYRRHLGVRYGKYWRGTPRTFRGPVTSAIMNLPRNEALKRGVYSLGIADRIKRYQHVFSVVPGKTVDSLFHTDFLPENAGDRILECWSDLLPQMENSDELGGLQFLELRSSLPDELLMYADKLSMAHGLEARVPYLDLDIIEFVESLPAAMKVRRGVQKWLHRKVCQDFMPRKVLRRKKRGFGVSVVDDWFRESVNRKMDHCLLDDYSLMYRYLEPASVQTIYREHTTGKNDYHKLLFSLVLFEEWLRVMDGGPARV